MKRFILHMIADMIILLASFLLVSSIYPAPTEEVVVRYQSPFLVFVILFLIISFSFNKYENISSRTLLSRIKLYAQAFMFTMVISLLAMYLFQLTYYSRLIILGTMLGIAVFEFIWIVLFHAFQHLFFKRKQ